MPRKPLPDGLAKTVKLYTKVAPSGAAAFREKCRRLAITEAEGIRQALKMWTGAR